MCGILGIFGYDDVFTRLVSGLNTIQHRGQDSSGIVTFDGMFRVKKGNGYVNEIFKEKHAERMKGYAGLGHVRYSTAGTPDVLNAQPFTLNYPFGLAMAHNGNVVNYRDLQKALFEQNHRILETENDVALILYTFASELEKKNLKTVTPEDIFDSVAATLKRVHGAYSTIGIIAHHGFLAFTDPHGIRPLIMGVQETEQGPVYAFASESTTFDYLGFKTIRDLEPGEAVFIDMDRKIHARKMETKKRAFCVFEYIYFAREDSVIHGKLVAAERMKMGQRLAKLFHQRGLKPDLVMDVPSSSYFFASALAEELGIPYRRGLAKNNFMGRSFILPTQEKREHAVRQKLNPIRQILEGKKVAVVDDSIVRGTTSNHIVRLIREAGAREVYFVSASPPIKHPCVYGIDMSIKVELIAARLSEKEIADSIGADALIYQEMADLEQQFEDLSCCHACFNGCYPTKISLEDLAKVEKERIHAGLEV